MVGCSFYTSYSLVGQIAVSITYRYESIVYGNESTVYVVVDTLALLYMANPKYLNSDIVQPCERLTTLWDMLIKIEEHELFEAISDLAEYVYMGRDDPSHVYEDPEFVQQLKDALDRMKTQVSRFKDHPEDLKSPLLQLNKMKYVLSSTGDEFDTEFAADNISRDFGVFKDLIFVELKGRLFYYISGTRAAKRIQQGKQEFGNQVLIQFPEARYDLDEAAKCMGFELYTACVFHLVRPMESAVRKVGKRMGATVRFKKKEGYLCWGSIANNINDRLTVLKESDQDEYQKWVRVHGMLECVRQAWRNETMHPGSYYNEKDAEEVYGAVKMFLQHIVEVLGDHLL